MTHSDEIQHALVLLCERLSDLMDKVRDARFDTSGLDVDDAERHLRTAEMFLESAWQAVEKAVLSGRSETQP